MGKDIQVNCMFSFPTDHKWFSYFILEFFILALISCNSDQVYIQFAAGSSTSSRVYRVARLEMIVKSSFQFEGIRGHIQVFSMVVSKFNVSYIASGVLLTYLSLKVPASKFTRFINFMDASSFNVTLKV